MSRCPICELKPMNCDCSEEARQLYYLRQEMEENQDEHTGATPEAIKQVAEAIAKLEKPYDKQAERREFMKQFILAYVSAGHDFEVTGIKWLTNKAEEALELADKFAKEGSHD